MRADCPPSSPSNQESQIAKFCPNCGNQLGQPAGRFCPNCGHDLAPPEAGTPPDEQVTLVGQPLPPEGTGPLPPEQPPPRPPATPGGPFPWKIVLPVVIACVVLAAGVGAALAAFTDIGKSAGSGSGKTQTFPPYTGTISSDTTSTRTATTRTTNTQTSRTQADSRSRAYITAMDRLIAQNDQLEKQITVLAQQINAVAPAGITDQMLADVDKLGIQFLGLNTEADGLDTPAAFGTSTRDFKQLTSYNQDRCDAMYGGSLRWRNGESYTEDFTAGKAAKEAYNALYPAFIQEYQQAKAAAQ